jgi:hypothetical protein
MRDEEMRLSACDAAGALHQGAVLHVRAGAAAAGEGAEDLPGLGKVSGPSKAEIMEMKELVRKLAFDEITKKEFDQEMEEIENRQLRLGVPEEQDGD